MFSGRAIYTRPFYLSAFASLRSNDLQLLIAPKEVVGICLRQNLPFVRFLHKILVPLLLCEADRVFLALKIDMCALYKIGRGLPTNQRVLPSVSL